MTCLATSTIVVTGGATAPAGFRAGGIHCGIRRKNKDLALLVSDVPATVAGVFTTNRAVAAPVIIDRQQIERSGTCRALVVNSGVANACTGERGMIDGWEMVRITADALGISPAEVLVSSTGVIGEYLPMDRIEKGIRELAPTIGPDGSHDAALAIMTTDTKPKEYAIRLPIGGTTITIGAMAKGSGMIAPNMATMLGFVTTDLAIEQQALASALRRANAKSFNRISVDGDASTNDMVLVMANGLAANQPVAEGSAELEQFEGALEHVLITLAKMIASDGEGATKLIEVEVIGAASEEEGEKVARTIAESSLVKTAVHGADANWGRIVAAIGRSGVEVDPAEVSISFGDVPLLRPGYDIVVDEERAHAELLKNEVNITVDLHRGSDEVRFWTCDLTREYVTINAAYRT